MADAARRAGGLAPYRLQQTMYANILVNWRFGYARGMQEEQRCCLEVLLRKRGEEHYQLPAQRSRILVNKWIRNFKIVTRIVTPRVSVCLLRAGLHGWFTTYRFGERNTPCRFCHRQIDSLDHMSDCPVSRKFWRTVLPTLRYDKLALLGYVDSELSIEHRVHIACVLFVIHEFHRFLRFHAPANRMSIDECVHALLLHAAGCLHDSRHKHVRDFMRTCIHAPAHR